MRYIQHLNNRWQFKSCFEESDLESIGSSVTVHLPHTHQETSYNYIDGSAGHFVSYYEKVFEIEKGQDDERVFIGFEGVAHYAKVYINGIFAGEHIGGYTGFELNITGLIRYGEKNKIGVVVDATERKDLPPFGAPMDFLTYGGIYREVYLKRVPAIYIQDVFVHTANVLEEEKQLYADVKLSKLDTGMSLQCTVINQEGRVVRTIVTQYLNEVPASVQIPMKDVALWDIDNPYLYTLNVMLLQDGHIMDESNVRFGFREAVFKSDGFYLNGKRLKLRGLNRQQSFESVGYAMPKSMQEQDAVILKEELGVNCVRTSYYPQSRHFLNKCDELGLIVVTEIPGWGYVSEDATWRGLILQQIEEMIIRDRNHPSIVLWSTRINESPDCDELYELTNHQARNLDPTRQTVGVRGFTDSELLEDVYAFNDFTHMGENPGLEGADKIVPNRAIPYLVTEHTGHMFPTKRFDHEERRLEHALRHLAALEELYSSERISGAIGSSLFDYPTRKEFGSGDCISYHGVMDLYRIPKLAAYAYASQQDEVPVLEIASTLERGDHDAGMLGDLYIFTNCDFVKFYRNETFMGDFYPDDQSYPHLPHPPVIISDFVGGDLEMHDGYSRKDAEAIKEILMSAVAHGGNLPLKMKAKLTYVMMKNGGTLQDGIELYTKYINGLNNSNKPVTYTIEGYTNGEKVRSIVKTSSITPQIIAEADQHHLKIGSTYDVTRIVVKAVDEYGNLLPYANDVVSLNLSGPIELIGSSHKALIGGAIGFYIKTQGAIGTASVQIKTDYLGEGQLTFKVSREA